MKNRNETAPHEDFAHRIVPKQMIPHDNRQGNPGEVGDNSKGSATKI